MDAPLSPSDGAELTALAVAAVAARLRGDPVEVSPPRCPRLRGPGASFVTLENNGRLLGCIGTLEPVRPLYQDVVRNALRAMNDPRFPPVTAEDWTDLDVKVSVLTLPTPLAVCGRAELLAALRPGVDGLTLRDETHRATFLPAVWHKLPDPDQFVGALLVKGGWSARGWPKGVAVSRYESAEYADRGPRAAL